MQFRFRAKPLLAAALVLACVAAQAASQAPVAAENGMVVTAQHLATRVGVDVLKAGGNAIDAAVAVGYALAVVYPAAGNLGGGGFMTLQLADGRKTFLDFREKAPLAATANMYLDKEGNVIKGLSTNGHLAVGVPGTVSGPGVRAQQVRHHGPRRAPRAGGPPRAGRLRPRPGRHRPVRDGHRRLQEGSGHRGHLPEQGRSLQARRAAGAGGPGIDPAGDQRNRRGRLLQGRRWARPSSRAARRARASSRRRTWTSTRRAN